MTMTDTKQLQQGPDASWDVVNSLGGINQTLADSIMTLQDGNLTFMQNLFSRWMELLTHQTESVQQFQQQWGPQIPKQQGVCQKLTAPPLQLSLDFLLAPLTLSRKLVEASMTATQRERELDR